MDIRLRRTWFAPDTSGDTSGKYVARSGRVIARGHRLRKGLHLNLPDTWRKLLPPDAQVLNEAEDYELEPDEKQHEEVQSQPPALDERGQADIQLAQAQHAQRLEDEAEEERRDEIRATRQANLAKARAAKQDKQKEKTDNA